MHHPFSHIWHTSQWGDCSQRHQTQNHVEWSIHEHACPHQVPLQWHMHSRLPQKVTLSSATPSFCNCWNRSNALCPCPHFTCPKIMAIQETTLCEGILLNTLRASFILPHSTYMSMRQFLTKTFDSKPLRMICSWARLPSSSATRLAHAFRTPTKLIGFGFRLPVAFAEKLPMPCGPPHISHVQIS